MFLVTFVIEVELRRGVSVIPGDVLHDATQDDRCVWTMLVDVQPQRQRKPNTTVRTHTQSPPSFAVKLNYIRHKD